MDISNYMAQPFILQRGKLKPSLGDREKLTVKQAYANALNFQSRSFFVVFFFLVYHANGILQKIFSIVKCTTIYLVHTSVAPISYALYLN